MPGIVVRVKSLLRAVLVDHLAKIALLVEQAHADHGHAQVARGFELIAGYVTKSSRIDRERFAQHEFHAEIRHTSQGRLGMILLKPRRGLRRHTFGSDELIDPLAEGGIGQPAFELVPRDRLQDGPGVIGEFPQRRIKLPPHFVGAMTPRPAHIQRQLRQVIDPLDVRG